MQTKSESSDLCVPILSRFRGCLLGGAVGDALGAPVEFWSRSEILRQFGPDGVRDYIPAYGRIGAITDDTQMSLFTADALLRSFVRGSIRGIGTHGGLMQRGYLRWYRTQGYTHAEVADEHMDGWLLGHRELFAVRAPGNTCLEALRTSKLDKPAKNQSKGCGTVMRVAPIGLYCAHPTMSFSGPASAFDLGMDSSRITHGHITATLSAGFLSALITSICMGETLEQSIETGIELLVRRKGYKETLDAIEAARIAAAQAPDDVDQLAMLGEGWVAEEALSIALYCALGCPNFESAVSLAVSHDGDSDSTGAIVGNILGALDGEQIIPERWLEALELQDVVRAIADDLSAYPNWHIQSDFVQRDLEDKASMARHAAEMEETERTTARYPPF